MKTTTEQLNENQGNSGHIATCGSITDATTDKMNRIIEAIESSRNDAVPQPGDIIICINPERGVTHTGGHMEKPLGKWCNLCWKPMAPFAHISDGIVYFDTSGGPWATIDEGEVLTLVGTQEKLLKEFAATPCANGAVYFTALVNVWEWTTDKVY